MRFTGDKEGKFRGGVRYYHRHTDQHHERSPDWEERHSRAVRQRWRRRFLLTLWTIVLLVVVWVTFALMVE